MSEKRFKLKISSFSDDHMKFMNIEDNGKRIKLEEIVDKLNELYDENEQLRKDCTILVQSNQEYRKENEQLKEQLKWKKEEIKTLLEEDDNDE